jgi:hypothetical protein
MAKANAAWVRHLPTIGIYLFLVGMALIVGGTTWELARTVDGLTGGSTEVTIAVRITRAVVSLGEPLMFNAVILYIAGRAMAGWRVSIVGLLRGPDANLFVKGPDPAHVVRIGRKYKSISKAEGAANTLRDRLRIKEDPA